VMAAPRCSCYPTRPQRRLLSLPWTTTCTSGGITQWQVRLHLRSSLSYLLCIDQQMVQYGASARSIHRQGLQPVHTDMCCLSQAVCRALGSIGSFGRCCAGRLSAPRAMHGSPSQDATHKSRCRPPSRRGPDSPNASVAWACEYCLAALLCVASSPPPRSVSCTFLHNECHLFLSCMQHMSSVTVWVCLRISLLAA